MASFNIPWKCLESVPEPKNTTIGQMKIPKSFAQAVTNLCDFPISQFPQPVFKGDGFAIEIPEVAYQAGLEACKHNLHGRVLWPKGSTPLSVVALKAKLSAIWIDLSQWGIISLGVASAYFSELCGARSAIEIAYSKNWLNIWLETDSSLVVSAFKNPTKSVACSLRNRWNNVLFMITQMNCIVTHIYREGNQVADLIANHGLSLAFSTS
ncbi:ribonuclease H [Trifolium pratense]|uniref:Ribonuclease H n=1 Tax=Trifolium pratense TaxID=57577 RepID=A0A2K3NEL5_TRIPR|nr:ribonuclease H [Trifolium pratense]